MFLSSTNAKTTILSRLERADSTRARSYRCEIIAHVGKMTALYERSRVGNSAKQIILPLRVGDIVRDGTLKAICKPKYQPSSTEGLKLTSSPSFRPRAAHDKLPRLQCF